MSENFLLLYIEYAYSKCIFNRKLELVTARLTPLGNRSSSSFFFSPLIPIYNRADNSKQPKEKQIVEMNYYTMPSTDKIEKESLTSNSGSSRGILKDEERKEEKKKEINVLRSFTGLCVY